MTKSPVLNIKRVLDGCLGLLSRRFKILAWHSVAPQSRDLYEVSAEMFQRQLQLLNEEGYSVISLESAWDGLRAGQILDKTVVITFDDGFRGLQEHAFPLLEQYRFPATVFVPFDYVGGIDSFSYSYPRPDFEILTLDEMKSSRAIGINYGSHTMSHADLTSLSDEQLSYELNESKKYLNEGLERDFSALAYPFGMYDERVKRAANDANYDCALCFGNILSNSKYTLLFEMKREKILNSMTLEDFVELIDVRNDFHRKLNCYI